MNVVNQIAFDEETQHRAEARAAELGISFGDYVRRLVVDDLGQNAANDKFEPETKPDISIFFDLGASTEPTDIARDKDKLIGESVWEEYLRSTGRKQRS
jgi:hypothetical protein